VRVSVRRHLRGRQAGALAAVVAVGSAVTGVACVRIESAPNGVTSVRLDPSPAAIILGDSFRDSLGVPTRVRAVGYDASGNPVATATFRYSYVPYVPDTSAGAVIDNALVVDSATGAVRATKTWVKSQGRVFARIGATLQLADTLQIVPRPNLLLATPATHTLRFDCTDPRAGVVPEDTLLSYANAVGPFTVVVKGDSMGTSIPVRRWLVRWSVDTVPAAVPNVTLATGKSVPAIAIIRNANVDRVINYDTTDAMTGTSSVLLRIRPTGLGKSYVADTLFRVTLRAEVFTGTPVSGNPAQGVFSVQLSRHGSPPTANDSVTCQR
nr:hypothetical protein [Candidatus Eremiobacteraeota bacterium]